MMSIRIAAIAVAAAMNCAPMMAQNAPTEATKAMYVAAAKTELVNAGDRNLSTNRCQIHVFAADKIKAYVTGFNEAMGGGFLGPLLDGKRGDADEIQALLRDNLGGRTQAELLAKFDLGATLKMTAPVVVYEPTPTSQTNWKATKGARLATGGGDCYAEIIVRDFYFLKTALFSPALRVNYTIRDYRHGAKPRVIEGRGGVKLDFYPTVSETDPDYPKHGFGEAFLRSFNEFVVEQRIGS